MELRDQREQKNPIVEKNDLQKLNYIKVLIQNEGEVTNFAQNDILKLIFGIIDGSSPLIISDNQNIYKPKQFDYMAQIDIELNQITNELR